MAAGALPAAPGPADPERGDDGVGPDPYDAERLVPAAARRARLHQHHHVDHGALQLATAQHLPVEQHAEGRLQPAGDALQPAHVGAI